MSFIIAIIILSIVVSLPPIMAVAGMFRDKEDNLLYIVGCFLCTVELLLAILGVIVWAAFTVFIG